MQALTKLLDRLAVRRLSRDGLRLLTLQKEDNALLVRNGGLTPIFATQESKAAAVGALWVGALLAIGNDPCGDLTMQAAVVDALYAVKASEAQIDAHIALFERARAEKRALREASAMIDETDGLSAEHGLGSQDDYQLSHARETQG